VTSDPAKTPDTFDPLREAAQQRIQVIDRPDGSKEFVLPALRNFRQKIGFTIAWVILLAVFLEVALINARVLNELPGFIRFIVANHTYFFLGILGLIELLLTYACFGMWFRSSRIIAVPGELRVVTHWLIFKRSVTVPVDKIIEIRLENTSSEGENLYYEILVLTRGDKRSRLAFLYPAKAKAGTPFTENDLKVVNTGGRRIHAATDIKGKPEASWLLQEINRALERKE